MLSIPYSFSPAPGGEANRSLWLKLPSVGPEREPLRHLLLGSPAGVQQAIHTLHKLNYVEPTRWSQLIVVPPTGIVITPLQGEVMSYLIRERSRD